MPVFIVLGNYTEQGIRNEIRSWLESLNAVVNAIAISPEPGPAPEGVHG